jgi:hypothetical protein
MNWIKKSEQHDIEKALRLAFNMGQDYWRNADHEFTSRHRKADEIRQKFEYLVADTLKALPPLPEEQG